MPTFRVMVTKTEYYDVDADSANEAINFNPFAYEPVMISGVEHELVCIACLDLISGPDPFCEDCQELCRDPFDEEVP